jgi:CarD family transcriptional regulator
LSFALRQEQAEVKKSIEALFADILHTKDAEADVVVD